jgi:hypothetical protein
MSHKYKYTDAKGVDHELHITLNPDGSAQVNMTPGAAGALTSDIEHFLAHLPPGYQGGHLTIPFFPVNDQEELKPCPQAPAPPVVIQAKARTFLPLGTKVVLSTPGYVRVALPDEDPIGEVTRCEPGFLDWYVDITNKGA